MAKFIPRLSAPGKEDKHWLHYKRGGVNKCVHIKNGSVLPNCTGYAWGRWYELLGKSHNLSRANAEVWWRKEDGYERGQVPRLGAVCCWSKGEVGVGKDGAGHVAIVEQIKADGSIVTSNSAYGGSRFYKKTLKPPYVMKGYDFLGFIYLPMEFDVPQVHYRVYADGRWLSEVAGTEDYAGIMGKEISGVQMRLSDGSKVTLRSHICGKGKLNWLSPVTAWDDTSEGYSGWKGKPTDCIAMKAEGHVLLYRVHILGGGWLPWVSGYSILDRENGFAGVYGEEIDALQIEVVE